MTLEAKAPPFRGCSNVKQVPPVTRRIAQVLLQVPTPCMSNSNANRSQINKACSSRAMSLTRLTYIQSTVCQEKVIHFDTVVCPLGRDSSISDREDNTRRTSQIEPMIGDFFCFVFIARGPQNQLEDRENKQILTMSFQIKKNILYYYTYS